MSLFNSCTHSTVEETEAFTIPKQQNWDFNLSVLDLRADVLELGIFHALRKIVAHLEGKEGAGAAAH